MNEFGIPMSSQDNSRAIAIKDIIADRSDLVQGIPFFSHTKNAQKPKLHTAKALDIHIKCTLEDSDADRNYSKMSYNVEWLTEKERKEPSRDEVAIVFDAEALQSKASLELDKCKSLLIIVRGKSVRIIPLDGSVLSESRSRNKNQISLQDALLSLHLNHVLFYTNTCLLVNVPNSGLYTIRLRAISKAGNFWS